MSFDDARFDRQIRFAGLGAAGQERLGASRAAIVGCGALGGALALQLVRSGLAEVRLFDRDVVELSNLPRQVLFGERDIGRPKAEAAREELLRIGGPTRVAAQAVHVDAENLNELVEGVDLVLDGTDNLATRYLLNDYAVQREVPWVYGGVVGSSGLVLAILPRVGPCLRCLFPTPAAPGSLETCASSGVILPAVQLVASVQAGWALRILSTPKEARAQLAPRLALLDAWSQELRTVRAERDPSCPCCALGEYEFLDSDAARAAVTFCGRNTVQVRPARLQRTDLEQLARRAQGFARAIRASPSLLDLEVEEFRLRVFPDGRALVEGTEDPARARAVYDRYVGS